MANINMFHLMPYRELPEDFEQKNRSIWVDIPSDLFDPVKAHQFYNDTLDELELGAALGFDGICVNEHHQNAYGMMPSPNIMAATLARRTKDVAIVLLGNSIALHNPPIRIAEEIAMLDCISGGRIISGFPVGSVMDTTYCYGANPGTIREKYIEAHDLIIKAWTEPEIFSWDGKYTQLRYVNLWPRPIQKPHPPIWLPGGGTLETWDFSTKHQYSYAALSYNGYKRGKATMDAFWARAEELGDTMNPYRAGFLQLVAVGENEGELQEFAEHAEFFSAKNGQIYPGWAGAPGYRTMSTIQRELSTQAAAIEKANAEPRPDTPQGGAERSIPPAVDFARLRRSGNIVAGSAKQVSEQLEHVLKDLRIGQLMVLCQYGSMPHDLAEKNIRRFTTGVIPNIKHVWSEWEDHWYPTALKNPQRPAPVIA